MDSIDCAMSALPLLQLLIEGPEGAGRGARTLAVEQVQLPQAVLTARRRNDRKQLVRRFCPQRICQVFIAVRFHAGRLWKEGGEGGLSGFVATTLVCGTKRRDFELCWRLALERLVS
eukprot:2106911-Rhodomonas_salina.1